MSLLKNALRYEHLGWYVLPIHPSEKRPLVKWAQRKERRPTPDEINQWWTHWAYARIAIATGALSGVDVVDLDGPQAFEKFAGLCGQIPNTISQITGRAEGGRHFFFKHNGLKLKNHAGEGIDLRTDGGIVVIAPSSHPSGNCYRWDKINPIEHGLDGLAEMPAELVDYFKSAQSRKQGSISKISSLTTDLVPLGQRHNKLTRLVGKWINQKIDHQTIKLKALDWYESLPNKSGFPIEELYKQLDDLLERYGTRKADGSFGAIAEKVPTDNERNNNDSCENLDDADQHEFPEWVMTGAAGKFAATIGELIETPKQFLFFSYLTALGLLLSPKLNMTSILPNQPRLYTVLLGESGTSRKSTAISIVLDHFQAIVPGFKGIWGVGSAEGLEKLLKPNGQGSPPICLLIFDEMKSFVGKCSIETSILLPAVNTLFEGNRFESHTKKSDFVIDNAHIAFLAATTVATYERIYTPAFLDIGFVNRVWLVPGTGRRKNPVPGELKEPVKSQLKIETQKVFQLVETAPSLEITTDAIKRYESWYFHELENTVHSTRLDTYSRRLMPLLAANDLKSEIDVEIVERVIALCNWQLRVRRRYDPIDAESKIASLEEAIRRVLNKGPRTERQIKQSVHYTRCGIWVFNTAMGNLEKTKEIVFDKKTACWKLLCS